MIQMENECVGCPTEMGCLGSSCPYNNVPHYYCDDCGEEEQLYHFEEEHLCIECIKKRLQEVDYDNY